MLLVCYETKSHLASRSRHVRTKAFEASADGYKPLLPQHRANRKAVVRLEFALGGNGLVQKMGARRAARGISEDSPFRKKSPPSDFVSLSAYPVPLLIYSPINGNRKNSKRRHYSLFPLFRKVHPRFNRILTAKRIARGWAFPPHPV